MTLNLTIPQNLHTDFTPRITVIGVGGGGTNAVDNMIALDLQGVEFVVANTDAQQLLHSKASRRIQLGPHLTQGLGAGAKPEIGRAAAEEAAEELERHLDGTHMVFITAGMGGGTGTGAAPVIARMAREKSILTVGVVTRPFSFEGQRRARAAEEGIAELQQFVDTLIVIPNQNLFRLANERTSWREAFKMADNVLYMGVRGVTDLMVAPGLVNLDFADIRTVMAEMGKAMMGTGEAEGENRAIRAAEAAISNPLLEDISMAGARGLLINITGGDDMTLFEVDQAANRVREEVDEEANIIFGSAVDEQLTGRIRVSVVATGIDVIEQRETERPRLVAVGAGVAVEEMPATAPPPASPVAAPNPALRQAPAPNPALPPWPMPGRAQPLATPRLIPAVESEGEGAPAPAVVSDKTVDEMPEAPPPRQPARPVLRPPAQPARHGALPGAAHGLGAAGPQPQRRSLFNIVTGAIRGTLPANPPPGGGTARAEPQLEEPAGESAPKVTMQQTMSDEMNIEIPAFLRRQSS
jgi:cell division protein FtsZ